MVINPLFPDDTDDKKETHSTSDHAPSRHHKKIEPVNNPAADLIRQKLDALYNEKNEPDTKQEIAEVEEVPKRSKHQDFMYQLSTSGKSLAEIQTEWHNYYVHLPDDEKHEVWQEFYASNAATNSRFSHGAEQREEDTKPVEQQPEQGHANEEIPEHIEPVKPLLPNPLIDNTAFVNPSASVAPKPIVSEHKPDDPKPQKKLIDRRTTAQIKNQLLGKIQANEKVRLHAKHHLQSLLFGLGFGALVIVIVLFSFFNEVIIAPFIQPSRDVSATPIIVSSSGIAPTKNPEVIIPKINAELPLDFSVNSPDENAIENALEDGVVHYPTTVLPGQKGNTAFFGHSSNNIFNGGSYKFAFVLLHDLVPGDTFYLTYGGKVYSYQVFKKQIVSPNDVDVLNPVAGKTATATLITCDPPGTSINRLVVWGEQISPDPNTNAVAAPTPTTSGATQTLPGNGPTLWTRMVNSIKSWF